jgi:hypothetical protein
MNQSSLPRMIQRLLLVLGALGLFAVAVQAAEPGAAFPPTSELSDQKIGSVLVFPLYLSSAATPTQENTRFTLTNQNFSISATLHLFFVNGTTGVAHDLFICLTPNQTAVFRASEIDPGTRGFMVAITVDLNTGVPLNFNHLSGETEVKLASGARAGFKAEAIAAVAANPANVVGATATLAFDGTMYNRMPRALAVERLKSTADGNTTILAFCRVEGNYTSAIGGQGALTGTIFNDAAQAAPFTLTGGVQEFITLSDSFPLTPVYSQFISASRNGWLQLWRDADAPLFGVALNFNPAAATGLNRFNGGHTMHKLTLTATGSITIPVVPPSCQ